MSIKRVYLTAHAHTRAHLVHTDQDERLAHKHSRPADALEPLSGAEPQGGAGRPLFVTRLQKKQANQLEQSFTFFSLNPPRLSATGLDWTSRTKEEI